MSAPGAAVMQRVLKLMNEVYGPSEFATVERWKPRAFDEGKGKSRYLWTDAYGVCNYLTLYKETHGELYLKQAEALVSAVHESLGRQRDGTRRLGDASDLRPCLGGLRIGKPKNEGPDMDEDGQYFHYLTKWMFALNRMFLVTREAKYHQWAVDLARVAHHAFVHKGRMFWKMSIDLSKPLVNSEGGLDAYDGLAMFKLIQAAGGSAEELKNEISEMQQLVNTRYPRYSTNDTLDAGEALWLSSFFRDEIWAKTLKAQALKAIETLWQSGEFGANPAYRLAFREFGTTIGVQMHEDLRATWNSRVEDLHQFWLPQAFLRDRDITPVMLCTSMLPGVIAPSFLS